ncbi:MAG: BREX system P-loop protein BrxC [Planctomycetaceae bacterium]
MAVALKTLFRKPVDRPIEGVIKADDESGLKVEVEEYVITGEVIRRLDTFLDSYNNYENANGVWISGFFGSGKSHLLKMLSLLLETRQIPGCDIVEEFLRKLNDNETLKGLLRKAVSIPSRSILFNIDQKADIISKDQADALLAVFVKVFDETCGYYGKQPYIAQFERQLDQDGLLDDFKREFEAIQGKPWDWGRDRITRVSDAIDKAYQKVTGAKATGVIDRFHADYKLSIEDFAEQVNKYIKTQPEKNFRLNFFVDEVGQYIAENTKLMTNLQTIAESLNTRCKGRAWVIVTAQKDMNSVVGEMEKDQANDFSKIRARFVIPMNLASQDVAEVIQERLLKKEESKESLIGTIYDQQSNNFKTLFDFTDDSRTYKNYRDKDHFISCYPFIPYQFDLFQASIQNLSEQNAFEGKHQSVGERSMLGVFQDVAKQISNHELGQLATFDLMFEGIRATLRSQVQSAINTAERNLDNKLAVRLLKALFLVKYVREFKATIRNLSVLMLEGFNCKVAEHQKAIEEALRLLETETYIQRNGELYEFLTDEEKDVEQDIKNTEVELAEVAAELGDFIFDGVIRIRSCVMNRRSGILRSLERWMTES